MSQTKSSIIYDFQAGSISDANLMERCGISLMRTAAWLTHPISFVGFSYAAKLVNHLVHGARPIQTWLFPRSAFEFPYADGYWGRLLYNQKRYSPDIEDFLFSVRDLDYAFIDCGANYGYMSVIVTSETYGNKAAVAIEADPNTFALLERNAELNNNRFNILNRAIFSRSGDKVNIFGSKHEARSILDEGDGNSCGEVETISLDDVAARYLAGNQKPVILKLDVEGVEIDALKGAENLLKSDCLIIYEDHGSDEAHEVTRFVMEEMGLTVYRSTESGCEQIKDPSELTHIKKNPRVGYDFLATNSKHWKQIVENCKY